MKENNSGNTVEKCLEELQLILNRASCAENETEERKLLNIGRKKSFDCLKKSHNNAEANFAVGLVMYKSHTENESYGKLAVKYLEKAVELKPNHELSKLYLGHYFYDVKDYEKALFYFENVDKDYFTRINQHWRKLNLNELILCCKIFLGDSNINLKDFYELEDEYLQADSEDVLVPFELAQAIYQTENGVIWKKLDVESVKQWFWKFAEKISFSEPLVEFVKNL